jgi:hypothetical protein
MERKFLSGKRTQICQRAVFKKNSRGVDSCYINWCKNSRRKHRPPRKKTPRCGQALRKTDAIVLKQKDFVTAGATTVSHVKNSNNCCEKVQINFVLLQ